MSSLNLTIGTAGHVDHGKTSLVKFLTGCDTDRLKEEKERGMSIELGFAPCKLRDLEVGIVDVPGHEDFVKTMVAGASGMDVVVLVVAADDGVMPQTREHLDILGLLGVRTGLVVLSKVDRVDPSQAKRSQDAVRACLKGTFLENAAILPFSSVTGEGYDAFYEELYRLARTAPPRNVDGLFRLPVERAFAIKGHGTIVSGIPAVGTARAGEELVILPQGTSGRLRGMQVYGQASDIVLAGQCAALNVPQWDHTLIRRGNVVTVPGFFVPSEWYLGRLRLLPDPGAFKNSMRVRFHTGTSDVPATVYLMQGLPAAGEDVLVQIRTDEPVVAGPADRFILRSLSPVRTIGGGVLLEGLPRRLKRNRPEILERARALARAVNDEKQRLAHHLATATAPGQRANELAVAAKLPLNRVAVLLQELVREGQAFDLGGGLLAHAEAVCRGKETILEAIADFHRRSPESPGLPPDQLAQVIRWAKPVLNGLVALLQKEGTVVERAGRLAQSSHHAALSPADRQKMEQVETLFRKQLFHPPDPVEIVARTGMPADAVRRYLRLLQEHQRLVMVAPDRWFHRDAIAKAGELVSDHIRKQGRLESVDFKYLLDTTRKFAIPLLDHLDRIGITIRSGNTRYLRK